MSLQLDQFAIMKKKIRERAKSMEKHAEHCKKTRSPSHVEKMQDYMLIRVSGAMIRQQALNFCKRVQETIASSSSDKFAAN